MNGRKRTMELDDFKSMVSDEKLPVTSEGENNDMNMESFIEKLKANDLKDRKRIITFIIVISMFIVVYSGSHALQKAGMRTGYELLILGFALILLYLLRLYFRNKKVDYSTPTITFLHKAEQRYRFMAPIDLIITVPLLALLISGGGMIVKVSFARYYPDSILPLVIYLIFMAGVVVFGFWASYRNWLRDKGRIIEEIRKLKKEFEDL